MKWISNAARSFAGQNPKSSIWGNGSARNTGRRCVNMAATAYRYYEWERGEYRDLCNIGLAQNDTLKINRKMCRHYKIRAYPPVVFFSKRFSNGRGQAHGACRIKVGYRTTLNVFAHEFAHILNSRTGGCNHDRKFKRWHKKVVTYVRARNYFGLLDRYFKG
jgi:hypothetical protein